MSAGDAGIVRRGARLFLDVRIDDRDQADALLAEVGDQTPGIGKRRLVPRERRVAVLVVDVEPDHIRRDLPLPEVVGDEADLRIGVVAVARLLIAERPARRHRHPAGEIRVALDDVLRRRPVDDVVVQIAALGAEREQARRRVPDIEVRAERVVEKDAVRAALPQNDVERHAGVDRIRVGLVGERVAVPHRHVVAAELPASLVQMSGLFAETEDLIVVRQSLPHARPRVGERDALLRVILVEHRTRGVRHREPEGVVLNRHHEARRAQTGAGGADLHRRVRRAQIAADDGIRVIPAKRLTSLPPVALANAGREPDADDVGRDRGDGCDALAVAEGQRVARTRRTWHRADRRPLRVGGNRRQAEEHGEAGGAAKHGVPRDWWSGARPAWSDGRLARSRAGWFRRRRQRRPACAR